MLPRRPSIWRTQLPFTTALRLLFYSIFGTNDQIATAGGILYDNSSTIYAGSTDDTELNAEVERIESMGGRALTHGDFMNPVEIYTRRLVTLHTTLDAVVPFQQEMNYSNLVAQKGNSAFLSVVPVPRYGHCNFTSQEIFQAITLMVQQAEAQLVN